MLRTSGAGIVVLCAAVIAGCRPSAAKPAATTRPAAQRIISIAPNATEIIGLLGQSKRLVGVSTFCLYPPEVRTLPRVGGLFDANLERILELAPDLIVLRGHHQAVERLCAEQMIALYFDKTERLSDIGRSVEELGRLLECPAEAVRVEKETAQRLARIKFALSGRKRPRVLMTLARSPEAIGQVMTGNRETFVHDMIEAAGGENPFASLSMNYPRLSAEAVLAAHVDVIIEAMPETPPAPGLENRIRQQWERLGPMPASRDGRIHVLTDANALIPSPRIVDIIAKIAKWLHPDARLD